MQIKTFTFLLQTFLMSGLSAQPGSRDSGFGVNGLVTFLPYSTATGYGSGDPSMGLQSDGKIINLSIYYYNSHTHFAAFRFKTTGQVDSSFGNNGQINTLISPFAEETPKTLLVYPDDRILIAGETEYTTGGYNVELTRYKSDGTADPTFGTNGIVVKNFSYYDHRLHSIALQPDGKIVLGGYAMSSTVASPDFAVFRIKPNGDPDSSFGINGMAVTDFGNTDKINSIALQSDGKILATGNSGDNIALVRYQTNGSLDSTFGTNGKLLTTFGYTRNVANSVKIQTDNNFIVGGSTGAAVYSYYALRRFKPTGIADSSFGLNGTQITNVNNGEDFIQGMAIQADGKIIVAGYSDSNNYSGYVRFSMARYTSTGNLDAGFGNAGIVQTIFPTTESYGFSMLVQPDGKIIEGGASSAGVTHLAMARFKNDFTVIPIKLLSFNAYKTAGAANELEWTTVNESSNEYFIIERSANGNDWTAIGRINCLGSGTDHTYVYKDIDPYPDISYYRLNQFFSEGSHTYSAIRKLGSKNLNRVALSVYPNPVAQDLQITYTLAENETIALKIFNVKGELLQSMTIAGKKGINSVNPPLTRELISGYYYLTVSTSDNQQSVRFIKK